MKGKTTVWTVFALVGLVFLAGCNESPTARATKCIPVPHVFSYELSANNFEGAGGFWNSDVKVSLTNKDNLGGIFRLNAQCTTVNGQKSVQSERAAIAPGDTYPFTFKLDTSWGEDYKCIITKVEQYGGSDCQ